MRARMRLHVGAFGIALVAPLGWVLLLYRDRWMEVDLRMAAFALPGVAAAQIAALLRWPALARRALDGRAGWPSGLGMASITHVLFGVFVALGLFLVTGPRAWLAESSLWALVPQALFFTLASLGACGIVTFVATALLARHVATRHREELAHDRS